MGGQWLIAGGEDGRVDLFDLKQNPSPFVVGADLRTLTGHTNPGDIEIRALWLDGRDSFIFAGSSGGNDQTRGLDLPSFFVLYLPYFAWLLWQVHRRFAVSIPALLGVAFVAGLPMFVHGYLIVFEGRRLF